MVFRIDIETVAGKKGTVESPTFNYVDPLNMIREGFLKFNALNSTDQALLVEGSKIKIYRNGTQEFYGDITDTEKFSQGGIKVTFGGAELTLGRENGSYANSPWISTASATTFADLINESSEWNTGTIEAGITTDFRASKTASILNSIGNLRDVTGQDIEFNDSDTANLRVNVLDHRGSSTVMKVLNEGIEITNTSYRTGYPLGNDVRVYGKGDGENQIKSALTSGQDAASKTTYGTITKPVYNADILTVSQANDLADTLVAKYKLPVKIYSFRITDPTLEITTGDVVRINSPQLNLDDELRVTAVERGLQANTEFLSIEVTNKEFQETSLRAGKKQLEIEKRAREARTTMQGTTNVLTFAQMINATSAAPLRTQGQLPSSFIFDEAGNNRVNSFTCDYDVDPFRSSVGTATEDSIAPSLTAGTTDNHKHNPYDSGHPHGNATQTSSANYIGDDEGSDFATNVSCANGVWTTVVSEYVGSAAGLTCDFYLRGYSGGAEDIQVRIRNSGFSHTVEADCQFGIYIDGFRDDSFLEIGDIGVGPASADSISLEVKPLTGAINLSGYIHVFDKSHTHSISSWNTNSANASVSDYDRNPGLNGNAASHDHNVAIGDDVSDAGSLNATSVDIYVDHWNGSSWIQKHSVLSTGKTIDTDVDISNGGTLPDAAGYWRTRIYSNSANADLINSIIKVKHELDT